MMVRTWQEGLSYLDAVDGVHWYDAPRPRRWHKCKPQTRALMDLMFVERCPCGAIRIGGGRWMERNGRIR